MHTYGAIFRSYQSEVRREEGMNSTLKHFRFVLFFYYVVIVPVIGKNYTWLAFGMLLI